MMILAKKNHHIFGRSISVWATLIEPRHEKGGTNDYAFQNWDFDAHWSVLLRKTLSRSLQLYLSSFCGVLPHFVSCASCTLHIHIQHFDQPPLNFKMMRMSMRVPLLTTRVNLFCCLREIAVILQQIGLRPLSSWLSNNNKKKKPSARSAEGPMSWSAPAGSESTESRKSKLASVVVDIFFSFSWLLHAGSCRTFMSGDHITVYSRVCHYPRVWMVGMFWNLTICVWYYIII